jgi:hypothetical protein
MVTVKKTQSKTTATLIHNTIDGKKEETTIKVGPAERKFIADNADKIYYDRTAGSFQYREGKKKTTLQRALYSSLVQKPLKNVFRSADNDYRVDTFLV